MPQNRAQLYLVGGCDNRISTLRYYCDTSPDFCKGCFNNRRDDTPRPLVSVNMVTYNHSAFVREALQSVLAQTYSPLEIIISDDASTDDTASLVDDCLARYNGPHRVRFLRQPVNLGARGRNNFMAAFRESQGKFIVWFCGDDVMRETQVERMVETWQREQVSLVTVNAEYIGEKSEPLNRYFRDPSATPDVTVDSLARNGAFDCNFGAGMAFSRELIETFGFDETSPPPQFPPDLIFPFYAGLLSGCAMVMEPLLRYRLHAGQTSLSLQYEEEKNNSERLLIERKMWSAHADIAQFIAETLAHRAAADPQRFDSARSRLMPLLAQQTEMMTQRLNEVARRIDALADPSPLAAVTTQVRASEAELCEEALRHLRSNDLNRAAEICKDALSDYPNAGVFWFTLALIMRAEGDTQSALKMIEAALRCDPANSEYVAERLDLLQYSNAAIPASKDDRALFVNEEVRLDALTYAPGVTVYFVDVSDECNLRCVYCHQSQPGFQGKAMSSALLETMQQMIITHPPATHAFLSSGGETTTLKNWEAIVQRFVGQGVSCAIISNFARLFSPDEVAALASLRETLVSIDTIDAEITKRTRKRSDVRTILFNMQQVKAYCVANRLPCPRFVWNVVGHDLALLHAPSLAAAAVVYRPDHVTVAQMKPIPGLQVQGVRLINILTAEEITACAESLKQGVDLLESNGISVSVNEQLKAELGLTSGNASHEVPAGMTRDCLMPWEMFLTHSDGTVKPCCNAEGVTVGRIAPGLDPFDHVFNGEQMRMWRKSLMTGQLNSACKSCTSYPTTTRAQLQQRVQHHFHPSTKL